MELVFIPFKKVIVKIKKKNLTLQGFFFTLDCMVLKDVVSVCIKCMLSMFCLFCVYMH